MFAAGRWTAPPRKQECRKVRTLRQASLKAGCQRTAPLKAANLKRFTERIEALSSATDLIVLPEMFTTGFSMNAHELAEPEQLR